jgi:hypothetical protein
MADALSLRVAIVPKNAHEDIRISLTEFKGVKFADVRIFAKFAGPAEARGPTKAGVAVPFASLPALITALQAAEAKAREMGLLDGGAA